MWLRSSRNRGFFWLACWLGFPVLNALVVLGARALRPGAGLPLALLAGALALEACALGAWTRRFGSRERRALRVVGGTALVVCLSVVALGLEGIVLLLLAPPQN